MSIHILLDGWAQNIVQSAGDKFVSMTTGRQAYLLCAPTVLKGEGCFQYIRP